MLRFIGQSELGPDQLKALDAILDDVLSTAAPPDHVSQDEFRTALAYLLFEEARRGRSEPSQLKAALLARLAGLHEAA